MGRREREYVERRREGLPGDPCVREGGVSFGSVEHTLCAYGNGEVVPMRHAQWWGDAGGSVMPM